MALLLLPVLASGETLLYDNGPVVNSQGTGVGGADESLVQTDLGLSYFGVYCHTGSVSGFRCADDFSIEAGPGQVDRIVVYGFENLAGTTSTVTRATLRIWDGPPGDPASTVVFGDGTTNRLLGSSWIGAYRLWDDDSGTNDQRAIMRVEIAVGTSLASGTYWLDWNVNATPGGQGFMTPFITIDGVADTGNGLVSVDGAWQTVDDHGHPQGLPFRVESFGIFSSDFETGDLTGWSGSAGYSAF